MLQKMVMEGSVTEVEERIRNCLKAFQKRLEWDDERMEKFGERIRGMVEREEKRKGPTRGRAGGTQESAFRRCRVSWFILLI